MSKAQTKGKRSNFTIKVGFADIEVKHVKMKDFGEFNSLEATIKINENLSGWTYMQTFRHEILHAAAFVFGISDMELCEERWVDFSSAVFTMVERDNLGIFDRLNKDGALFGGEA